MSSGKKFLGIHSVHNLFSSDDMESSDDELLNESYNQCIGQVEKRSDDIDLLNDGADESLNEACKSFEETKQQTDLLNDGLDDLLNESYDSVKSTFEIKRSVIPENLMFAMRRTKKEIQKNKLLAKIRLIERKCPHSERFKNEMSDFFFPFDVWPNYAIELLLTNDFGYTERIGLACFFHGNGLRDNLKALRMFMYYNKHWRRDRDWDLRFFKFQELFKYLDQVNKVGEEGAHIRHRYWYFDINMNLTMFYDGSVRTKNGEKRKYYSIFHKYETK